MPEQIELRQEIEALAMKIVVEDLSSEAGFEQSMLALAVAVRGIRDRAEAGGCGEVAGIASELCATLESADHATPGVARDTLSQALETGVAAMQQALENAAVPAAAPGPAAYSLAEDPELLSDFVLESREHLAAIESRSLALEQDPGNAEAINSIFRAFHTIKGLAGFLELNAVREVSHNVETVLDLARNGKLTVTSHVIDVVLECADYLKICVSAIDSRLHGHTAPPLPDFSGLLERVRSLMTDGAELKAGGADLQVGARPPTPGPRAEAEPAAAPVAAARSQAPPEEAKAVKVDTGKLDYLVDMAGELVIAQSMVRHDPDLATLKSPRLQRNLAQLARITAELQKTSMSMRLVPIGQLFQRVARQVRDLSRKMGKPAELDISGEETEIDRTIVEELADPLMHMVRNSLDHGIEGPDARKAAGKHPMARIGLRACHQAGHIVIEISDDGRGLDAGRIVAKALENGLVANPEHLSENDVFHLIFEPGFSTAAQVTDVSGRGVGMDVVRRQIQKLRGHIEIQSRAGEGATFTLKVPLTLAIIDGLVVGVGRERYIVPLFAVREMFRPAAAAIFTVQNRSEMVMMRGNLLAVVRLYRKFGVNPRTEDPCQALLIVAEGEGQRFCLMVDELIGKQEAVIKSLGDTFKDIPGIAGGAILGDGRVALILDLAGIIKEPTHE
ncbi:MAG: chemotaxis protein CheA [Bryobacteraceae bacterium]|jgi:two-component system chemotaxis sensor kinase CheA